MLYSKVLAGLLAISIIGTAAVVQADLTVKYRATHSELVLFKQPQEAPFARVSYTLYVSGTRVRTELVDALGHPWWFVADRESGEAYSMDPERRLFWREQGTWTCDHLEVQVAAAIARLMQVSSVQDLEVSKLDGATVGGVSTRGAAVHFSGRVLGSPAPVATELDVYFPFDEDGALGKGSARDLYCGTRPSPTQWAVALQAHVGLDETEAAYLGSAITIPLRLSVRANLGVGQAELTLETVESSRDPISAAMFQVPDDFSERK